MATAVKRHRADDHDVQADILIIPAKIQKARLKVLHEGAVRKGFSVRLEFSEKVTHIVTELNSDKQVFSKLGIDSLAAPVEVVNTMWLSECIKAGTLVPVTQQHYIAKKQDTAATTRRVTESVPEYACKRVNLLKHQNEKLVKALILLEEHAEFKNEYSRALAFRRGAATIRSLSVEVLRVDQVRGLPHIGKHCEKIVHDILENGYSPEVEEIGNSSWHHSMRALTSVYGIGPNTATKWITMGINCVADALENPQVQRTKDSRVTFGLAFYEDMNLPVTRAEMAYIKRMVQIETESLLPGVTVEATGGFRRGKQTGHDVDLLISHPVEGEEQGLLEKLLLRLNDRNIVLQGRLERSTYFEDILQADMKKGHLGSTLDHFEKWIGVVKVKKDIREKDEAEDTDLDKVPCKTYGQFHTKAKMIVPNQPSQIDPLDVKPTFGITSLMELKALSQSPRDWYARRVDLIIAPASQYYYALVGWTGSKHFNRSLRHYAQKELNMKLTSHGLYDLSKKEAVPAQSEREVFVNLNLPYREPHERNC